MPLLLGAQNLVCDPNIMLLRPQEAWDKELERGGMDVELVTNLKQRMTVSKCGTHVRAVELSRLFLWAESGLFQEYWLEEPLGKQQRGV